MIFRKPLVEENHVMEQPKSRFQLILDEYTRALEDFKSAHGHLDRAAHYFSTLMMDAEKGMNFIDKFRQDLTQALQDSGTPIESDIEEQIADFIPKNVKAAE